MSARLPSVKDSYFPLAGGLDHKTPGIAIPPGRAIDAQNYETEINGGYRRIDGYERFDGRASPTAADYTLLPINKTGTINIGDTVTGATSTATGKVLAIAGSNLVIGRVTGNFGVSESLTIGGNPVGAMAGQALQNGASMPSDHADYKLLAANDLRNDIGAVPGSGPVRGVWVYNDIVYAFRDNVGATAGDMYKATSSGWVKVNLGYEIQFTAGTAAINVGDVIANLGTGATSTCTVLAVVNRTGAWGSAVGTLIVTQPTGAGFANGAGIFVGSTQKATASAASAAITRAPGGKMEFANINFTGSTNTEKMYGVDGVNTCFEFNGSVYVPIRTGMAQDKPTHVCGHKNYLFLSFLGSVQYSALGNPYAWSVILGAGEIGTGSAVSGFMQQGGDDSSAALAIFTAGKTFILYGSSNTDFRLTPSIGDVGYLPFTMQPVSNNTFGLTSRGIQSLTATQSYGNFAYTSVSHLIQDIMDAKAGLEVSSTVLRAKNQYRLYFSDGTGIAIGLTGDKINGILPLNYGKVCRCICSAKLTNGREVTYFGSDDGFVYQDSTGTSFDGAAIESWIRTAFNHIKSPSIKKTFKHAVLDIKVEDYAQVNVTYDLGYGSADVDPSAVYEDRQLTGGGSYWDQFNWDQFNWDVQTVLTPSISVDGTETSISILFYSNRAQDKSHTLQGVTLLYLPRRIKRST